MKPARRMWSLGAGNGIAGYAFDIDRATWGKRFKLRSDASLFPDVDLDITFYYDSRRGKKLLLIPSTEEMSSTNTSSRTNLGVRRASFAAAPWSRSCASTAAHM